MTEGTYEDGYRAGWESVAGNAPVPSNPTQPPMDESRDHASGFKYGRADALAQFTPRRDP